LRGGQAPGDDSSDSSDESDSSGSDTSKALSTASTAEKSRKKQKRKAYRRKTRALKMASMVKMEPPQKYDGKPSIDVFEKWLYHVNEYFKYNQLSRTARVRTLPNYLSDKAARWFMDNVAQNPREWTLDSISRAMVNDLFPRDIKDKLRARYEGSYQGNMSVREWSQYLERNALRITDVSPEGIARKFWDGAKPYLRIKWTENGYTREFSKLAELQEAGERYEAAEALARLEAQKSSRSTRQNEKNETHRDLKQPRGSEKASDSLKPDHSKKSGPSKSGDGKERKGTKLTSKEKEEHRAAGKCFECHQTGHLAKDCPKRTTAKAPKITLGAISFVDLEDKAKKKADLSLYAVEYPEEIPSKELVDAREQAVCCWAESVLRRELNGEVPYPIWVRWKDDGFLDRFIVSRFDDDYEKYIINDTALGIRYSFTTTHLFTKNWDIAEWARQETLSQQSEWSPSEWNQSDDETYSSDSKDTLSDSSEDPSIELMTSSTVRRKVKPKVRKSEGETEEIDMMERTAARAKDFERVIPKGCIIEAFVNGNTVRVLVDSGSMADFISTTLVDQLKIKTDRLEKPLTLQLAVTGSRGNIHSSVTVDFKYLEIEEKRRFDVINLENYDVILGTPFLFQHKCIIGLNPTRFAYRSCKSVPIEGTQVAVVRSMAADVLEEGLEGVREMLREEASDLCKAAEDTPLPPFRDVNHRIPIIDENVTLPFIPSRCPAAFRTQWEAKRDTYLRTGRWRYKTGSGAVPMLFVKKKPGPNGELRMRTVFAKQLLNANTRKLSSPLPDMESILYTVTSHKYRSLIDGRDAYEQIRVESKDVHKTLFNTPDGTMESLVMQQGDCNAGATYQTLMNHLFGPHIGVFMYVYLDDIIIFSDTIEDHVKHIRAVLDILRRERLYLTSSDKLQFFATELVILGNVIDEKGIKMDTNKVNKIENWKVPTNGALVAGFTGMVQWVAKNCFDIAKPLAILSKLQGKKAWRWGPTEQRAFEEVKSIVSRWQHNRRVTLDRSPNAKPVCMSVDASLTGAGAVIWQGDSPENCHVIAFWSGKFNSAEQNYPTHERELLGIVATILKYEDLLFGTKFTVYSDHQALERFMLQKKLTPRQHRWLEKLTMFDFNIEYIKGEENVYADALSRIYSDEPKGIVRASSEYVTTPDPVEHTSFLTEFFRKRVPKSTPLYTAAVDVELELYTTRLTEIDSEGESEMDEVDEDVHSGVKGKASQEPEPLIVRLKRPRKVDETPVTEPKYGAEDESDRQAAKENTKEDGDADVGGVEVSAESSAELEPHIDHEITQSIEFQSSVAPSLTYIVSESKPGIQLPEILKHRYSEDSFFAAIAEKPEAHKHFILENGFVFLKDNGRKILCIPDLKIGNRRVREILISHAHSILAHLGARKTLLYLKDNVWWKSMQNDISEYCKSCPTCVSSKPTNAQPYGLLRSLPIPSRPWEAIGIDFVGPLPSSSNRDGSFDMVCVVIDHLTSMVHLIPTRQTYKAKDIAEMVFEHVYKLHGLPDYIVSDRDSYFTSIFWKELNRLIGVELRLSSAYHPQTDGTTERANRTMVTMLRQAVEPHQKNWVTRLPAIEFAMNSARSETTGFSPFFLNSGKVPRTMIWDSRSEYPGVHRHAQMITDAIMTAHDSILAARVKSTVSANRSRKPAPFAEGDLVYLSTKNLSIPKERARKLVPKFIGPFTITKVLEPGATFRLDLPDELKARGIHPSFHASLLRIHHPNDDRKFPGRTLAHITGFGKPSHWSVERIVSHYGTGTRAIFEVIWTSGDRSWELYGTVKKWAAFDAYCEALGIRTVAGLKAGTGIPPDDPQIRLASVDLYKQGIQYCGSAIPDTASIPKMSEDTQSHDGLGALANMTQLSISSPEAAYSAPQELPAPAPPVQNAPQATVPSQHQPSQNTIVSTQVTQPTQNTLHMPMLNSFDFGTAFSSPSSSVFDSSVSQTSAAGFSMAQWNDYQALLTDRTGRESRMQATIDRLERQNLTMMGGAFLHSQSTRPHQQYHAHPRNFPNPHSNRRPRSFTPNSDYHQRKKRNGNRKGKGGGSNHGGCRDHGQGPRKGLDHGGGDGDRGVQDVEMGGA
jgi:hypothetical protein